ncbi:hypothetical protein BJX61DRAFT_539038 [Aspergillus egyptiacus]|nr:hypothetical protein BJX61DRAFT_539038 [Aspergillus egyptiacus]
MSLTPSPFISYQPAFQTILGPNPTLDLALENPSYPFAHEAGVYTPTRFQTASGESKVQISKVTRHGSTTYTQEELSPSPAIPNANGGTNYQDGILFCSQGSMDVPSALVLMSAAPPYNTTTILDSFYGRQFNSINDVVIHSDGSIWFTDPTYGYESGIRPAPELPSQVYRFDPATGSLRVVADGFSRPNGIAFSPDESVLYVTDTQAFNGNGSMSLNQAATVYAFDVQSYSSEPFLVNRRVFAMTNAGIPDGIKVDMDGNVYSACQYGDGVEVWSPGGVLLGKILIESGPANFFFAQPGELFSLSEERIYRVGLSSSTRGALLRL